MRNKLSYENALLIPILGNTEIQFYTNTGLHIATGYNRIVIGGRGPYIEFETHSILTNHIIIPVYEKYRINSNDVYYIEYRTIDTAYVKLYYQKKYVKYADYKLSKWYISPYDLFIDNNVPVIQCESSNITINDTFFNFT